MVTKGGREGMALCANVGSMRVAGGHPLGRFAECRGVTDPEADPTVGAEETTSGRVVDRRVKVGEGQATYLFAPVTMIMGRA